ncbi:MAG: pyrroloquinoline quinone biosynthesis peptide chaperone PqqD [Thermocrispum sp.]
MTAAVPESQRPALRRGVRLTYDDVRQTHVLLFPEGVLVPNGTAAAVLHLCDGEATVGQITETLAQRYAGVSEQDVAAVLARFVDRRVVEWR